MSIEFTDQERIYQFRKAENQALPDRRDALQAQGRSEEAAELSRSMAPAEASLELWFPGFWEKPFQDKEEPVPAPIKREISPERRLKESMRLIADALYLRLDELDRYGFNARMPQFRNKFTSQNFKREMMDTFKGLKFRSWEFYEQYGFNKEVISQERTEAFELIVDAIRGNELPEDLTVIPGTETLVNFISSLDDEQLAAIQDIATKPNFAKPVVEPPFPSNFEAIRSFDQALDQNVERALEIIAERAPDTERFSYRDLKDVFEIYQIQIVKGWDNGQITWEQNSTDIEGLTWMIYDRIKSLPRFPDSLEQLKIFIDRAVYEDKQKKNESGSKQI